MACGDGPATSTAARDQPEQSALTRECPLSQSSWPSRSPEGRIAVRGGATGLIDGGRAICSRAPGPAGRTAGGERQSLEQILQSMD